MDGLLAAGAPEPTAADPTVVPTAAPMPPPWGAGQTPAHDGTLVPPMSPTVANPAPVSQVEVGSIHQQLIDLDDLRRRGIVTEAEFQEKKAELLPRP